MISYCFERAIQHVAGIASRVVLAVYMISTAMAAEPSTIRYENCGQLTSPSPFVEINGAQLRTFLPKGTRCADGLVCIGERLRPLPAVKVLALSRQLRGLTQEWVTQASNYRKANRIVDDAGCSQLTVDGQVLYWETVWEPWDADSRRLYEIQQTFDSLIVPVERE